MGERERLEKKLVELAEEKCEVSVKLGAMAHTPKYDNTYSVVKLENWTKDVERLTAKETEVHEQLGVLLSSPEYQKSVAEKVAVLVAKQNAVKAQWEKTQGAIVQKRYASTDAIIDGYDAVKYVEELDALEEKERVLHSAYQYYSDAITRVSR